MGPPSFPDAEGTEDSVQNVIRHRLARDLAEGGESFSQVGGQHVERAFLSHVFPGPLQGGQGTTQGIGVRPAR